MKTPRFCCAILLSTWALAASTQMARAQLVAESGAITGGVANTTAGSAGTLGNKLGGMFGNATAQMGAAAAPSVNTQAGTVATPNGTVATQNGMLAAGSPPAKMRDAMTPRPMFVAPASKADRQLVMAAYAGNTRQVREALARGAKIEARDYGYGWTPLMWASLRGNLGTVRYLISRGAKVNARGGGNNQQFMVNAERMRVATYADGSERITATGIQFSNANITPLLLASSRGYAVTVRELLKAGAQTEIADSMGHTALMGAANRGSVATMKALLDTGAKVNSANVLHMTPLAAAIVGGQEDAVRLLLKNNARATDNGILQRPLALAENMGNKEIIHMVRSADYRQRRLALTKTPRSQPLSTRKNAGALSQTASQQRTSRVPLASGPGIIVVR